MGKVIIKEKEILQYTTKGLLLSYRKNGSDSSVHLRNVIECPFNMTYPVFSPIVKNFFIEDINHFLEKEDIALQPRWKKYKKSANYHIKSKKKATFEYDFVEKEKFTIDQKDKFITEETETNKNINIKNDGLFRYS